MSLGCWLSRSEKNYREWTLWCATKYLWNLKIQEKTKHLRCVAQNLWNLLKCFESGTSQPLKVFFFLPLLNLLLVTGLSQSPVLMIITLTWKKTVSALQVPFHPSPLLWVWPLLPPFWAESSWKDKYCSAALKPGVVRVIGVTPSHRGANDSC